MAILIDTVQRHRAGDELLETMDMGMRSEDFSVLASMLEGLYEKPKDAIMREYATNAWDSHVFAGNPNPIHVTLPTESDLTLTIEDFGLGMSTEDLRNTYRFYGASSKRHSNDVAGCLGVGSKSALSYAPLFQVTAVKDGVRTSAMVTKNEHGLGVIDIQAVAPTDAPNGVMIQVPVDRYDVSDFRDAAKNLFQFWSPGSVLIDGEAPERPSWLDGALHMDQDSHTILVRKDAGLDRSYVVMGNVPYPCPDARLANSSVRFVAQLNIGDVDHVPSRESVKHTPHTDKTLAELAAYIRLRFDVVLDNELGNAATRWDEAQMRALWQGKDQYLRGNGGTVFDYDSTAYTRRGARNGRVATSENVKIKALATDPNRTVIIGFPNRALSVSNRERLVEACGAGRFAVLPKGTTGIGMLDGRPKVHTWDEIVAVTAGPGPTGRKADRGPKVETRYYTTSGFSYTAKELANLASRGGKVIFTMPNQHRRYGDLGATVVRLYSSAQLPRVQRFVPSIIAYDDEVATQKAAAEKAITSADRAIEQARTLDSTLRALPIDKVDDPGLATHIRLAAMPDTETMVEARRFGIEITHGPLFDYSARYPLITEGRYYSSDHRALLADRLLYVNAKFAAVLAAEAEAATESEVAA
jgi:hypothetical protein